MILWECSEYRQGQNHINGPSAKKQMPLQVCVISCERKKHIKASLTVCRGGEGLLDEETGRGGCVREHLAALFGQHQMILHGLYYMLYFFVSVDRGFQIAAEGMHTRCGV